VSVLQILPLLKSPREVPQYLYLKLSTRQHVRHHLHIIVSVNSVNKMCNQ
jgi:hypothetical protein